MAKFDSSGNHLWSKRFEGAYAYGVAVDSAGNINVVGGMNATVNFGGTSLTASSSPGSFEMFLAQLTP